MVQNINLGQLYAQGEKIKSARQQGLERQRQQAINEAQIFNASLGQIDPANIDDANAKWG